MQFDNKEETILLDRDGHYKLAAFGLCEVQVFKWSRAAGMCVCACGTDSIRPLRFIGATRMDPKRNGDLLECVMYHVLGKCHHSKVCVHPQRYPPYLMQDAVSNTKEVPKHSSDIWVSSLSCWNKRTSLHQRRENTVDASVSTGPRTCVVATITNHGCDYAIEVFLVRNDIHRTWCRTQYAILKKFLNTVLTSE
jgi:hypothetical protein